MRVVIIDKGNGDDRVHSAGCADVDKDLQRYGSQRPITIDVESRLEVMDELYCDIAEEQGPGMEHGTAAHNEAVRDEAVMSLTFLPCCKDLP